MSEYLSRDAAITGHDVAARTLEVQLLRWDDARMVSDGGRPYKETWARDSLIPLDRLFVWDRHGGEVIGRMDPPTDAGPGPASTVHIAHTRAGDDLLALVDAEVIRDVSIEMRPEPGGEIWSPDRTAVTRTRALIRGLAFTPTPAHDAPILAREGTMEETPTEETPAPVAVREAPAPAGFAELQAEVQEMRAALMRNAPTPAPTWQYRDIGELWHAAVSSAKGEWQDIDPVGHGPVLMRAWTDITTTDVPGLLPPQQLKEIWDVIRTGQPLVEAAGSAPAPTSKSITYPSITLRPTVATQATEKTLIASSDSTVVTKTATVATFAGGNDISIQVIDWSDPSVLALLSLLYAEALAKATDQAAYVVYDTNATINSSIGTAANAWVTKFFDLAGQILNASGRFPDRIVLSTDLWVKIGGAVDSDGRPLFTSTSPTNPAGSASLRGPTGDVRELPFVVDPYFPADRGVMFASSAFRASLGPVSTMSVDVPSKLGRDVAWYRYGAFLAVDPSAMAMFATGTAPTMASASKSAK
jgi:HK97 family phage major capsid protein